LVPQSLLRLGGIYVLCLLISRMGRIVRIDWVVAGLPLANRVLEVQRLGVIATHPDDQIETRLQSTIASQNPGSHGEQPDARPRKEDPRNPSDPRESVNPDPQSTHYFPRRP
jgi:hypothetical protein